MADITRLSLEDLENDKADSLMDIKLCEFALLQGITTYSSGKSSTQYRLNVNKKIVKAIDKELERRQNE